MLRRWFCISGIPAVFAIGELEILSGSLSGTHLGFEKGSQTDSLHVQDNTKRCVPTTFVWSELCCKEQTTGTCDAFTGLLILGRISSMLPRAFPPASGHEKTINTSW